MLEIDPNVFKFWFSKMKMSQNVGVLDENCPVVG